MHGLGGKEAVDAGDLPEILPCPQPACVVRQDEQPRVLGKFGDGCAHLHRQSFGLALDTARGAG
eukprot:6518646-Prymnesium_polylepis.1